MKKKNILLLIISIFMISINSVAALEVEEVWIEYESGKTQIAIDKLLEFEEKLAYRTSDLNKLNLDKIYRYRIEDDNDETLAEYMELSNDLAFDTEEEANIWADENAPEVKGWQFVENIINFFKLKKELLLTRYETKKEAKENEANFLSTIDDGSTKIEEIRDEFGDITTEVVNDYKFNDEKDASNAAKALREDIHDYKVIVEVIPQNPELIDTKILTIEQAFDTKEKADEYIDSLKLDGYEVKVEVIKIKELEILNNVHENIEKANKALIDFLKEYPNVQASLEEIRNENGDTIVPVENNSKFDTEIEANQKAEELREDIHDYKVVVKVVKGSEFVETDIKSTTEVFTTKNEAEAYINGLKELGYDVTSLTIKQVNETSELNSRYETRKLAEEALADFLVKYPNTKDYNIEEIRNENKDTTVPVENDSKFDTEIEANQKAEELREDIHDYKVVVKVVKGSEFVETDIKSTIEVFTTKNEAEAYINGLKELGYDVTSLTIKQVNETSELNSRYETRKLAEEALADFLVKYPNTKDYNIVEVRDEEGDIIAETTTGTTKYNSYNEALEIADSLNEDNDNYKVVASVREASETVTSDPISATTEQFDTYEAAEAYINNLAAQGYDVSNLSIKLISYEESIWGTEDNVEVNPGTGSTPAYNYGHFDVTLLSNFTKIDAAGNKSNVTGTITISSVVINNKTIKMKGPSKDYNTNLYEYTSEERQNLGFTNNSLVKITGTVKVNGTTKALPFVVEGYLIESQNVCGGKLGRDKGFDLKFKSVTIVNDKVVIDTNVVNKYEVMGTYTGTTIIPVWYVDTIKTTKDYDYIVTADGIKSVGYQVLGNATKDIYKDIYTLEVEKTTKDYDYIVTADGIKLVGYEVLGNSTKDIYKDIYTLEATKIIKDYDYKIVADGIFLRGNAIKEIYQDVYTLDIKRTTKDYDYELSGCGFKTKYDVLSKYVRLADVNWIIEYMELGKGGDVEILPPQTGVDNTNSNNMFSLLLMIFTGLILVVKKFI